LTPERLTFTKKEFEKMVETGIARPSRNCGGIILALDAEEE